MTGFPHHALDTYLPKLIRSGYRVAICDQLEDPKLTKKLAIRDTKVKMPRLTKKQYELLCECIRYRCADNVKERHEAESRRLSTQWYDAKADELNELKDIIYNINK